ncbi:hypothetical protein AB1M95_03445 [Sulfitobacter sp. LCG007]
MPRKNSSILNPAVETPADKTTRIARDIIRAETESRAGNQERLRAARLERDAKPYETAAKPKRPGKPATKASD